MILKTLTISGILTVAALLVVLFLLNLANARECETTCYSYGNMTQCTKVCD